MDSWNELVLKLLNEQQQVWAIQNLMLFLIVRLPLINDQNCKEIINNL